MSWFFDLVDAIFGGSSSGSEDRARATTEGQNRQKGPYGPGRPARKPPPRQGGEYRVKNRETGEIEYIGITSDFERRRREHERTGKYCAEKHHFEWKGAREGTSDEDIRAHEKAKIKKHSPSENRRAGGGGRKPKKD